MTATWRKVRILFATQFALMTEYRAEVVIWMLSGTLSLVMMLVWMAQAAGAKPSGCNCAARWRPPHSPPTART